MFKNKKLAGLSLGILTIITASSILWKISPTSGTTNSAQYEQKMRNALGEAGLATSNSAPLIAAAPANLADFIYNRSGVQLSQANKDSLADLEAKSWNQSKRITQDGLTEVVTQVAFERLVTLSDPSLDSMTETMLGFDDPNMSAYYKSRRTQIMLRLTGEGLMTPQNFKNEIKNVRTNAIACQTLCSSQQAFSNRMSKSALRNRIRTEILGLTTRLGAADPGFSGGNIDDMTPAEAMLIAYAVVTNDTVAGTTTELQQDLSAIQSHLNQSAGGPYPSPVGRRPFGTNGYLYSTAASFLLDDTTTARLLDLIKEGSAIQ